MSERAEKLKPLLAELSPEERAELFACFESDEDSAPGELSDEWIDEINRRIADGEAGRTTAMPADEFMQRMKEKYG